MSEHLINVSNVPREVIQTVKGELVDVARASLHNGDFVAAQHLVAFLVALEKAELGL